jgi:hypothetical protein
VTTEQTHPFDSQIHKLHLVLCVIRWWGGRRLQIIASLRMGMEDTLRRNACTILVGKYERNIHLQRNQGIDGRIILEWNFFFLNKYVNDLLVYN